MQLRADCAAIKGCSARLVGAVHAADSSDGLLGVWRRHLPHFADGIRRFGVRVHAYFHGNRHRSVFGNRAPIYSANENLALRNGHLRHLVRSLSHQSAARRLPTG